MTTWRIVLQNRPEVRLFGFDEIPLDHEFPTRAAAEEWAIERFDALDPHRKGWRVEEVADEPGQGGTR